MSLFLFHYLQFYESEFMELTVLCPAVIICRCSPTQKAEVVRLLRNYAKKRTCAIGDGGNDVSMIQVWVLAPFSIQRFCPLLSFAFVGH